MSARTREFGVRLAVGSRPMDLRAGVLWDGVRTAPIGIAAGAAGGYALTRVAQAFLANVQLPGALPVICAAVVLIAAAIGASLMPAARASRVDVLQALRSEEKCEMQNAECRMQNAARGLSVLNSAF